MSRFIAVLMRWYHGLVEMWNGGKRALLIIALCYVILCAAVAIIHYG